MRVAYRWSAFVAGMGLALTMTTAGQAQTTPVPRPFPGSGSPSAPTAPSGRGNTPPPQTPPATSQPPTEPPATPPAAGSGSSQAPMLPSTVPVYPSADYLDSFDAGAGQRYYVYGTNLPYADLVAYYRTVLKNGGRELYKTPGMWQFDLGRFQDNMAYPPSIVVKDYFSENSPGYLFVSGTSEKRYRTIIQIVPPGPGK
ncbi:MAG TPA: hypothetical protein VG871_09665 [Vicinamibacterales bacterium]|nr:hypothetical protein [Vicinamibacterales bacterium]